MYAYLVLCISIPIKASSETLFHAGLNGVFFHDANPTSQEQESQYYVTFARVFDFHTWYLDTRSCIQGVCVLAEAKKVVVLCGGLVVLLECESMEATPLPSVKVRARITHDADQDLDESGQIFSTCLMEFLFCVSSQLFGWYCDQPILQGR